jgi:hypothetical protein
VSTLVCVIFITQLMLLFFVDGCNYPQVYLTNSRGSLFYIIDVIVHHI